MTRSETSAQTRKRVFEKISHCLHRGCVIRIEHCAAMHPRFTQWQRWGKATCYQGNYAAILEQLSACLEAHPGHQVRLSIEDYHCHSRFSIVLDEANLTLAA